MDAPPAPPETTILSSVAMQFMFVFIIGFDEDDEDDDDDDDEEDDEDVEDGAPPVTVTVGDVVVDVEHVTPF